MQNLIFKDKTVPANITWHNENLKTDALRSRAEWVIIGHCNA